MAYGFFVIESGPNEMSSFFAPVRREDLGKSVEDGGCMFAVEDSYIEKLQVIMDDPANENSWVYIEIAGDLEEGYIQSDPIVGSVFGFVVMPGELTQEEAVAHAQTCGKFESAFLRGLMRFHEFKQDYSPRRLN